MVLRLAAIALVALLLPLQAGVALAAPKQLEFTLVVLDRLDSAPWSMEHARGLASEGDARVVTLTPSRLSQRQGQRETITDFDAGLVFHISHEERSIREESLFAEPAFFQKELRNRWRLAQYLGERGQYDPSGAIEIEMLFGGANDSKLADEIAHRQSAGVHSFSFLDREFTTYSLSDQAIPAPLRRAYGRYLARAHRTHPAIRARLAEAGVLFGSLSYAHRHEVPEPGVAHTFLLTSARVSNAETISIPSDYRRVFVDARLAEVVELWRSQRPKEIERYARELEDSLDAGDVLRAFLSFSEYSMQFDAAQGDARIDPLIRRLGQAASQDPTVVRLRQAIRAKREDEGAVEAAIEVIEAQDQWTGDLGHVLWVFAANHYAALGEEQHAEALFYRALAQNPHLTGAYRDLGGVLYQTYEAYAAWAVWDQMRAVAPDHSAVARIDAFEAHIRSKMPGFF